MKPNLQQVPGIFDEINVLRQLESSGNIVFYNLMQVGYPMKIPIHEFYHKIKPYLELRHEAMGVTNCSNIFLLASGFQSKDFKFGKSVVKFQVCESAK